MAAGGRARGWSVFYRPAKRRWVLEYAGPGGRRCQKVIAADLGPARRRDAERWAEAWLQERALDPGATLARHRDRGRLLGDTLEAWAALRARQVRDGLIAPATHQDAIGRLRLHVAGAILDGAPLGERPLAEFDTTLCRRWLRQFRGTRAASTVRNTVFALAIFFDDVMAEGWTAHVQNPMRSSAITRELPALVQHTTARETPVLAATMAQRLVSSEAVQLHRRVRYVLALTSGARDGELAGLQWADIQLDGDATMRIAKALSLKGPDGYSTMGRTKNRRHRLVPLHPAAVAALREWQAAGWETVVGRAPGPDDAVFVGLHPLRRGEATRPQSARMLRDDLQAIGCTQPLRFHDLRATFISWMAQARVSETTIQRFVGQAGRGVTQRHYVHTEWADMVQALTVLPLRWQPAQPPASQVAARIQGRGRAPLTPPEPPTYADTTIENMALFGFDNDLAVLATSAPCGFENRRHGDVSRGSNPFSSAENPADDTAPLAAPVLAPASDAGRLTGSDDVAGRAWPALAWLEGQLGWEQAVADALGVPTLPAIPGITAPGARGLS